MPQMFEVVCSCGETVVWCYERSVYEGKIQCPFCKEFIDVDPVVRHRKKGLYCMSNLKRYIVVRDDQDGVCFCQVKERKNGPWVKFDDIKEFLKLTANTGYVADLVKISEQCSNYEDGGRYCDFCGHHITMGKFVAGDHDSQCAIRIIGERLNA